VHHRRLLNVKDIELIAPTVKLMIMKQESLYRELLPLWIKAPRPVLLIPQGGQAYTQQVKLRAVIGALANTHHNLRRLIQTIQVITIVLPHILAEQAQKVDQRITYDVDILCPHYHHESHICNISRSVDVLSHS
jgi:hypothetical protein